MYFPPSPFSLDDTRRCGPFVLVAYDMEAQWVKQGKPRKPANFHWTSPSDPGVQYSPPIWSHETGPLHLFNRSEPFGFVARTSVEEAWLVFRGTETTTDWIDDAEALQDTYDLAPDWGQVHAGFLHLYRAMRNELLTMLSSLRGVQRLFVTGHSLGSSLSTLAVPDILANTQLAPPGVTVMHYNFASPRVGDTTFAARSNGCGVPVYRIVNSCDLVPSLPLANLGNLVYEHVGVQITFTAQNGGVAANHSMNDSYLYAINQPENPRS